MKLFKLTAVAAAVLGSSVAMAQDVVVVDAQPANEVVVVDAQPVAYQYDQNAGVVANTAGAVVGTGKTLYNTVTHPAAVSAEIGTLGYGANIAWGVNETTELQAGWTGMDFDDKTEFNSNDSWINYEKLLGDGYNNFHGDFNYDVDFSNPYIGVQMRPWANNFTVASGIIVPDNKFKGDITAQDGRGYSPISINDVEYRIAEGTTVDMKIENKNKLAPYLTVGYRPNINQNWGGFFELGAAYMGKPKARVTVRDGGSVTANGTDAKTEFEQAAKKNIENEDYLEWYPILKAGLTYRF